jgi:hypothetical protein
MNAEKDIDDNIARRRSEALRLMSSCLGLSGAEEGGRVPTGTLRFFKFPSSLKSKMSSLEYLQSMIASLSSWVIPQRRGRKSRLL